MISRHKESVKQGISIFHTSRGSEVFANAERVFGKISLHYTFIFLLFLLLSVSYLWCVKCKQTKGKCFIWNELYTRGFTISNQSLFLGSNYFSVNRNPESGWNYVQKLLIPKGVCFHSAYPAFHEKILCSVINKVSCKSL